MKDSYRHEGVELSVIHDFYIRLVYMLAKKWKYLWFSLYLEEIEQVSDLTTDYSRRTLSTRYDDTSALQNGSFCFEVNDQKRELKAQLEQSIEMSTISESREEVEYSQTEF